MAGSSCHLKVRTLKVKVHDQEFERVRHIIYFGFILANDDNITPDILQRFVTNDTPVMG
jgi:hypothetical protein